MLADLSQKFSTYLSLRDCPGGSRAIAKPVSDPGLHKLVEATISADSPTSEDYWARFFLKELLGARRIYYCLWRLNSCGTKIALYALYVFSRERFLYCYLQSCCWSAAKSISDRLDRASSSAVRYPLEECFLIACELSLRPAKLLKRFDFDSQIPLQAYGRAAIQQSTRDRIARELRSKAIKFSGYGMLRNLSLSRLRKTLTEFGLRGEKLDRYCLMAQVFKELWEELQPPTCGDGRHRQRRLKTLDDRRLSKIARTYNQQLQRLGWRDGPISPQVARDMLETCIQSTRVADEPQQYALSLEDLTQTPAGEEGCFNPLDEAIDCERQGELLQVREVVDRAIGSLDRKARQGLLLSLGLQIAQSDLASLLEVEKQYQVARQLQRYQRTILRALFQFYASSGAGLDGKPTAAVEKEVLGAVKEYAIDYSRRFFAGALEAAYRSSLSASDRAHLVASLGVTNNVALTEGSSLVRAKLARNFQKQVEDLLDVNPGSFKSGLERVEIFIDEWLEQNQATLKLKEV